MKFRMRLNKDITLDQLKAMGVNKLSDIEVSDILLFLQNRIQEIADESKDERFKLVYNLCKTYVELAISVLKEV